MRLAVSQTSRRDGRHGQRHSTSTQSPFRCLRRPESHWKPCTRSSAWGACSVRSEIAREPRMRWRTHFGALLRPATGISTWTLFDFSAWWLPTRKTGPRPLDFSPRQGRKRGIPAYPSTTLARLKRRWHAVEQPLGSAMRMRTSWVSSMLHALSEQTPRSDSSPALAHLPHISFAPLSAVILSNELDCSRMRGVGAMRGVVRDLCAQCPTLTPLRRRSRIGRSSETLAGG